MDMLAPSPSTPTTSGAFMPPKAETPVYKEQRA